MNTMLETRYWKVKAFGWGVAGEDSSQAFLNKYFPGRRPLSNDKFIFTATEEEVAFCEFDCGAIIVESSPYDR